MVQRRLARHARIVGVRQDRVNHLLGIARRAQQGRCLDFALEALHDIGVAQALRYDDLESDEPIQPMLSRLVTAAANLALVAPILDEAINQLEPDDRAAGRIPKEPAPYGAS